MKLILNRSTNILMFFLPWLLMTSMSQHLLQEPCNVHLWQLQGFASDADYTYHEERVVTNQLQFQQAIQSYTLIRFKALANKIILKKIITVQNITNLIILGPITIQQFGLYFIQSKNIIIRDVRILNASIYGILISHSSNIIVDHCTIIDASRTDIDRGKCIDITQNTTNVTISNNILGYSYPLQQLNKYKGMLIANFLSDVVTNISIHHNIFYCNYQRSPQISTHGLFDMRQNIIFNYTEYGSRVREGAYGNLINNWYIGGKKDALVWEDGGVPLQFYGKGNTWKEQGKVQRNISDYIHHQEYRTPGIMSRSIRDTVSGAGCLKKEQWESLVSANVKPFI